MNSVEMWSPYTCRYSRDNDFVFISRISGSAADGDHAWIVGGYRCWQWHHFKNNKIYEVISDKRIRKYKLVQRYISSFPCNTVLVITSGSFLTRFLDNWFMDGECPRVDCLLLFLEKDLTSSSHFVMDFEYTISFTLTM